jgi:hypothetical protein
MSKTARRCRASARETEQRPAILPWLCILPRLARTDIPSGLTTAAVLLSMTFSENRYPLFGIMLRPPRNGEPWLAYSAREHAARENT